MERKSFNVRTADLGSNWSLGLYENFCSVIIAPCCSQVEGCDICLNKKCCNVMMMLLVVFVNNTMFSSKETNKTENIPSQPVCNVVRITWPIAPTSPFFSINIFKTEVCPALAARSMGVPL
jgi:hypothetical protein